jgi:glycosidase
MIRLALALCALLATTAPRSRAQEGAAQADRWWSRGVCYEVFVRSFFDSDGDGVGDLRGLMQQLPYISDLGASCMWLMPVAQSPSYHGYDVTNYYHVNRDYGTNEDMRRLIAEARRRGIHVIVDLVLNHMSSEHPYFKSALLDTASPYRDWFLWSPTQRRTQGWSAPTWHRAPNREEYYYGLFWHGMPDLNLASSEVTAEARRIARFWLEEMGVDGFRLDAVGHFFENGEDPRNGPGTHPWLRDFAAYLRQVKPEAFTVGEVWDSIGAIRAYYPDQLHAYFAFQVADSLVHAVRSGNARGLIAAVERVQREFPPGRWASFLRNHDQTRVLTEFRGDVPRAKLAAALLLTLPGIPFVYYGEEIGMTGDKPDPRLRTPMHWTRQRAAGFTRGEPWEPLQPDSFTANVEAQQSDSTSLLNHYRRLIRLRAARNALGSAADFIPLSSGGDTVLAYLRRAEGAAVLVLANLGGVRVSGPSLASRDSVLSPGRYVAGALFGLDTRSPLLVRRDGRIRDWTPVPSLGPFEARILELTRD